MQMPRSLFYDVVEDSLPLYLLRSFFELPLLDCLSAFLYGRQTGLIGPVRELLTASFWTIFSFYIALSNAFIRKRERRTIFLVFPLSRLLSRPDLLP